MKRSRTVLALAICLLAALALGLAACGGGGGDIVGTWTDNDGMEFEFTSDGAMIVSFMGQKAEATYSVKDGKLHISGAEAAGFPEEIAYKIDGDKVTMTSPDGEEQTLTRVK